MMFDFLKTRTPIERLTKRVTETGGEDSPRIEAAQKLADMATPEATFALAKPVHNFQQGHYAGY
jgi:hypothetical protein